MFLQAFFPSFLGFITEIAILTKIVTFWIFVEWMIFLLYAPYLNITVQDVALLQIAHDFFK